ncbi:DUF3592 domain-containing protein [Fodinicola acaciae]|uniref:DUF3592 domain-containing protein n=1 Tax=Fodinicola acaciae TaxID=2681555 RepID=UPI0013D4E5AA|nr:DUF3592 domain-containing protein [Fodinicola acaciae]
MDHFGLAVLIGLAVLLVVIGLVYVGGGVAESRRHALLRREGRSTKATLVRLRRSRLSTRAEVSFQAAGRTVTVTSTASRSVGRVARSKKLRPGGQVAVRYLPDDPANVLVDGFDTRTQPWTYLISGTAAIIGGLLIAAVTLPSLGWLFQLG